VGLVAEHATVTPLKAAHRPLYMWRHVFNCGQHSHVQEMREHGFFRPALTWLCHSLSCMPLLPLRWSLCRPIARHVRLTSNRACIQRRGRNLTERYRRLEITTRAKPESATHVSVLPQGSENSAGQPDGFVRTSTAPDTIAGFVIPQEPRVPADDGSSAAFEFSLLA